MRIIIDHRTRYHFSKPQARIVQMLRMTPQDGADQTVVNWHIGVDCDARLRTAQDGFGNRVTMLYADGPIVDIEIVVTGEVLTAGDIGLVFGVAEPLPPDVFLRDTPRTRSSLDLLAFAADAAIGASDRLEALHRLNTAIVERFAHAEDRGDSGRSADAVFADNTASARDSAHVFLSAARSLGSPARYVSGYRPNGDELVAPHAWAEAHVDGLGWVSFDPSRGISSDECYVRVAVGLDAATAAPIAGSRLGEGSEVLDVDLHVDAVDAQ